MTRFGFLARWRVLCAVLLGTVPLALLPASAVAQPVVQALADPAVQRLNEALRRLAQNPRAISSLIDAGQASLALDDVDAALGFFRRAEAIDPGFGRVKAGLAAVKVRQQQPLEALRLFAEAEQAGEPMRLHAAERGLAYDLIGDNARAQQDYFVSLSLGQDPAVIRRLALSQAIAGDQRASETTLLPLLQRSDLAAYRTRAFALAILGKSDEAVSIAETMLPDRLSSRMAPYLRYMPRLTRAQQAAAANLGTFPRAAEIGRDDPALAAYATQTGVPQTARGADARLVPSGEPLGRRDRESRIPRREAIVEPARAAPPPVVEVTQQPVPEAPASVEPPPQIDPAVVEQPLPRPSETPGPPPTVVASLPPATPEPEGARPSISITRSSPSEQTEPAPATGISLSEAFADFSLPAGPPVPAAGAVDITRIEPKRETTRVVPAAAPPKPATPPPPVHPSRHWVQVATGRDTGALAFDWRRVKREAGGLLDTANPHVAKWGQTNRLVAGPFASAGEANAMVTKLKDKEIDSFRFTSTQGEEVRRLD